MTEWSGPFVLVVDFGVVRFGVLDCVVQEAWL